MGMRWSTSAARISGASPPWWMSEPWSIIHWAMPRRAGPGRLPRNAALRHPGQRAGLAVSQRSAMQRGVTRHQRAHRTEVVGVDGMFQHADFVQRIDVLLELRPTGESVLPGDLELRFGRASRRRPHAAAPWPDLSGGGGWGVREASRGEEEESSGTGLLSFARPAVRMIRAERRFGRDLMQDGLQALSADRMRPSRLSGMVADCEIGRETQ